MHFAAIVHDKERCHHAHHLEIDVRLAIWSGEGDRTQKELMLGRHQHSRSCYFAGSCPCRQERLKHRRVMRTNIGRKDLA